MSEDTVNHPQHYNSHPSGVECITITEHMTFNAGNAVKYLWRAGLKAVHAGENNNNLESHVIRRKHVEDLRKAAWYINREIERLDGKASAPADSCPGCGCAPLQKHFADCKLSQMSLRPVEAAR